MTCEAAVRKSVGRPIPDRILKTLTLMEIRYYGFDGKVHRGQILIHRDLAPDIRKVFQVAFQEKFPFTSVIPVSHPRFEWDDHRSMAANNTSAFNYRNVTGKKRLSRHAFGLAIDINPRLNPYIRGREVLPPDARYQPGRAGTLTPDSPVVQTFLQLGWTWGGHWKTLKDYQHFQKDLAGQP
ncbi:D-alanyl-D-alanine carboxypeptidase [Desulfonema ishimotonii]|uniref:D-alanyl-D-alanine carboxypeptidase n=2 Tax=Desulfonema ishimotonii TaxID=45657 RepID=A0A401FV17_9BACT|nr:D-alanyl-D-alanine carboxypeptidase [Desulfonema ishimotonii]